MCQVGGFKDGEFLACCSCCCRPLAYRQLQVLRSGQAPHVTRVMLDNMTRVYPTPGGPPQVDVSMLQAAVAKISGLVDTEASGNVSLDSIGFIVATGVTYVSVGALTHSVKALDISLNIDTV
jgi:nicotinate-nucleotide pyrophosphorylase (carboxylating)